VIRWSACGERLHPTVRRIGVGVDIAHRRSDVSPSQWTGGHAYVNHAQEAFLTLFIGRHMLIFTVERGWRQRHPEREEQP
jgi:hypothetical protein